jgi:phospholipase/carboxylesterase
MGYQARRTPGRDGGPLIFTFHGTGGTEDQFHGLAEKLVPGASIVSPRGDVSELGALRYFRRKAEGLYDMKDLAARTEAMADFLRNEISTVAPSRVIGLGYSNGANILASVAFLHPEFFNDLVLMHPLIPWTPADQPRLEGARVLMTTGDHDPICPGPLNDALADWFKAQGAHLTHASHPGGHEIVQSEIAAIADFLSAFRR